MDEFGLETDLGNILGNATPLPTIEENSNNNQINSVSNENNNRIKSGTNSVGNETGFELNETLSVDSDLSFTLYSTNEDFIVSQIADVTGLSLGYVKKFVNFVYTKPENFEDEIVAQEPKLDFIEKVNGSVIIRLG